MFMYFWSARFFSPLGAIWNFDKLAWSGRSKSGWEVIRARHAWSGTWTDPLDLDLDLDLDLELLGVKGRGRSPTISRTDAGTIVPMAATGWVGAPKVPCLRNSAIVRTVRGLGAPKLPKAFGPRWEKSEIYEVNFFYIFALQTIAKGSCLPPLP